MERYPECNNLTQLATSQDIEKGIRSMRLQENLSIQAKRRQNSLVSSASSKTKYPF